MEKHIVTLQAEAYRPKDGKKWADSCNSEQTTAIVTVIQNYSDKLSVVIDDELTIIIDKDIAKAILNKLQ